MKLSEFALVVIVSVAVTLFVLYALIDRDRLCGFVDDGHRRCVVVVDRHD